MLEVQMQQIQQQLTEARSLAVTLSEQNQQYAEREKQWEQAYTQLRSWSDKQAERIQAIEERMDNERRKMKDQVLEECGRQMQQQLEELARNKDKEIEKVNENLTREQEKWNRAKNTYINEIQKLNEEIEELGDWWNVNAPEEWDEFVPGEGEDEIEDEHDMAGDDSFEAEPGAGDDIENEYDQLGGDDDTKEAIKTLQDGLSALVTKLSNPGGHTVAGARGSRSPSQPRAK